MPRTFTALLRPLLCHPFADIFSWDDLARCLLSHQTITVSLQLPCADLMTACADLCDFSTGALFLAAWVWCNGFGRVRHARVALTGASVSLWPRCGLAIGHLVALSVQRRPRALERRPCGFDSRPAHTRISTSAFDNAPFLTMQRRLPTEVSHWPLNSVRALLLPCYRSVF